MFKLIILNMIIIIFCTFKTYVDYLFQIFKYIKIPCCELYNIINSNKIGFIMC